MAEVTKKHRKSPGKVGDAVLDEYNHRCAVCGEVRPQIHHVDEDPSNNDPLNLLPLCPNCHLSDQHNPTAKRDPRLLHLFRVYKDPTILSSQFFPLFQRMAYLYDVETDSIDDSTSRGNDLVGFVSQLQMGQFYASKIGGLLQPPSAAWISVIPESYEARMEREAFEHSREVAYREQLKAAKDSVISLVVELLRYQPWPSPAQTNDLRPHRVR
jgi:hypothetical protein